MNAISPIRGTLIERAMEFPLARPSQALALAQARTGTMLAPPANHVAALQQKIEGSLNLEGLLDSISNDAHSLMPWEVGNYDAIDKLDWQRSQLIASHIQNLPVNNPAVKDQVILALRTLSVQFQPGDIDEGDLTGIPQHLPQILASACVDEKYINEAAILLDYQNRARRSYVDNKNKASVASVAPAVPKKESTGRHPFRAATLALLSPFMITASGPHATSEKPDSASSAATIFSDQATPKKSPKRALWKDLKATPIAISFIMKDGQLQPLGQMIRGAETGDKWKIVDPRAQDLDRRIDPASVTKLLTYATIMECVKVGRTLDGKPFDLNKVVKLTPRQKAQMMFSSYTPEKKAAIKAMETATAGELLDMGMTNSNNGAIWAVGLAAAGFEAVDDEAVNTANENIYSESFVKAEQHLATEEIGAHDTVVETMTGQPVYEFGVSSAKARAAGKKTAAKDGLKNNVSTVRNLAMIMAWNIEKYPDSARFLNNISAKVPGSNQFVNTSDPIKKFNPGASAALGEIAVKTGHTDGGGYLTITAWRGGIITVVAGFKERGHDKVWNVGNRCTVATGLALDANYVQTGQIAQYKGTPACARIEVARANTGAPEPMAN